MGTRSRAYPEGARRAEARNTLGEIRQRQEAYRAEFGRYTDLTGDATWWPATAPGPQGVVPWTPTPATRHFWFVARARGHFRSADRIDVLESRWDQGEPVMLE